MQAEPISVWIEAVSASVEYNARPKLERARFQTKHQGSMPVHQGETTDVHKRIYVDDLIRESRAAILAVKDELKDRFCMSDTGKLHLVLRIKVTHGRNQRISLSQERYIRTKKIPARRHADVLNPIRSLSHLGET